MPGTPALHAPPPVDATLTKLTSAGKMSATTTLIAVDGPLLVTVMSYCRFVPATTGSGLSTFVTARSASATTVTPSQARLLELSGSRVSLIALAQSLMSTGSFAQTWTVIVARAPDVRLPRLQVITSPAGGPQLPLSVLMAPKLKFPSLR